jgi:anthranilate synthase / indole-3-glycerol phosphate synthase / phosphoribosylanthranilate isomerase
MLCMIAIVSGSLTALKPSFLKYIHPTTDASTKLNNKSLRLEEENGIVFNAAMSEESSRSDVDILTRITNQRLLDVQLDKESFDENFFKKRVQSKFPSKPLQLHEVLASTSNVIIAAEFKRASPSKGMLANELTNLEKSIQCYTNGGTTILSVLTEPHWFKGSLEDMELARFVSEKLSYEHSLPCRPCILRKDFILDEYQILQARAFGADTVLLIVACIPDVEKLSKLISFSRSIEMEPLVEVNTLAEFDLAIAAGSLVIGINNRNLRTFIVDLQTTVQIVTACVLERFRNHTPLQVLSLSGIRDSSDISAMILDITKTLALKHNIPNDFTLKCLRGFLVGEALMRSPDPTSSLQKLVDAGRADNLRLGGEESKVKTPSQRLVKICGISSFDSVTRICRSAPSVDFVGFIQVPSSPRFVQRESMDEMVAFVKKYREQSPTTILESLLPLNCRKVSRSSAEKLGILRDAVTRAKPLTVGVFMNQPLLQVAESAREIGFDLIQLHGSESVDDLLAVVDRFPCPVMKVIHVPVDFSLDMLNRDEIVRDIHTQVVTWSKVTASLVFDTKTTGGASGGLGKTFPHELVWKQLEVYNKESDESGDFLVMLAGGLTGENVAAILRLIDALDRSCFTVWACDTSSGVEYDANTTLPDGSVPVKGQKDLVKVTRFSQEVRSVSLN